MGLDLIRRFSDHDANPGMTWPSLAAIGSYGRSNVRTYFDLSVSPSDMVTVSGLSAGVTLLAIASMIRKWLVVPESRTSQSLLFCFLTSYILRRLGECVWMNGA